MLITLQIEIEVERTEGKFASRDEIEELIMNEIEGADPGSITTDSDATYEIVGFDVSVVPQSKPVRKPKAAS